MGCTLACKFCHTGTQTLARNLTAREIVGQVLIAKDAVGEWPSPPDGRLLSNIVMMGMGEPLFNFEEVAKAVKIIMDGEGIAISKRRVTLSTAGHAPMIERCGRELDVNLAISLHAPFDDLRDEIVPLNRKYPIAELRRLVADPVPPTRAASPSNTDAEGRERQSPTRKALIKLMSGIPSSSI